MFLRLITQALLALSFIPFVPTDGAILERAAQLPVAPGQTIWQEALAASQHPSLPSSPDRYPHKVDAESLGVVTSAESVIVEDRKSGLVLFAKNPDAVRPIGSISKLMTGLVFLDQHPNLSSLASVLPSDIREGGRIYLATNDPVSESDLLHASLVGSDNTATMSLARLSGLTLDVFVQKMNDKAKQLGMVSTKFYDPTGLSADNVSTAQDLVRLLEAVQNVPEIQSTIILPHVTITQQSGRAVTIDSTDDLLTSFMNQSPFHLLGGKTGYLPEAGYCMGVGVSHDGAGDIFVVILGSESKATRVTDVKSLASWAYKVFQWPS